MTIPTSEPERLQSKRIEEMPEPLRWTLRRLGEEYGPLGVALAAAEFTDSHNGWEDSPCQSDAKDTLRALGVTDDEL